MTTNWDEIKRLASDFQKLQASSSLQLLSEPNCIEVVNLLVEQGLVNVIFTIDGREYITPEHFETEVKDELFAQGGRVNLVDLAKTLNVELSRVILVAEQLATERDDIHLVLGQLMTDTYLQQIASEINDILAQQGQVSAFDLANKHFDLPTEFLLHNVMERFLGTIIIARQDPTNNAKFFTHKYIARSKAQLRGALMALTLPTPVAAFFPGAGAQDAIFHQLAAEIGLRGVVTSRQQGALYVPTVYNKAQSDWVHWFYRQNGYLDYDKVSQLEITAPQAFIKRQLGDEAITFLETCCVGKTLVAQVESSIEDCCTTGGYLDVSTALPSVLNEASATEILEYVVKRNQQNPCHLFGSTILSKKFIEDLLTPLSELVTDVAKKSVESGAFQKNLIQSQIDSSGRGQDASADNEAKSDRKDDRRRKAAGGKGGGGTQGRETKTKSTKTHARGGGRGGRQSDSDDDVSTVSSKKKTGGLLLISLADIEGCIGGKLREEGLDELTDVLGLYYYPQFCKLAEDTARLIYTESQQNTSQDRRQARHVVSDKLNNALTDIRLYEKGLKLLPDAEHASLIKYLLKTLATDTANDLHLFVAAEDNLPLPEADAVLTIDQRTHISKQCSPDYRVSLAALNKSLSGGDVAEFVAATEEVMRKCSFTLKKVDKKRDRTLILCHKHGLLDKLATCTDAALVLHLTALVIFTVSQQSIVHASGKHVTALLRFLHPVLNGEQNVMLGKFHDLVVKMLSSPDPADDILSQVIELTPKIKAIATDFKKISA